MANELRKAYPTGYNLYATITRKSDGYIWDTGDSAFEAVGTWNDTRVGECDVALTDNGGGLYLANLPSGITAEGEYYIMYYEREGASPATTDTPVGGPELLSWTGTSETTTPSAGSGKTLADLKAICYYHGWQDSYTDGVAALVRFINNTLQMLSALAHWPFYHKVDGRITLATDDDDYVCKNSSDEVITNISKIGTVLRDDCFTPLNMMPGGPDEWMLKRTVEGWSGSPTQYTTRKYVTDGLYRIDMLVYPCPGSGQNGDYLYFPYEKLPEELALDTDETDWPNHLLWLLEEALDIRIAAGKKDTTGVALQTPEFMMLVNKAIGDSRNSYMPVIAERELPVRDRRIREIIPVITS